MIINYVDKKFINQFTYKKPPLNDGRTLDGYGSKIATCYIAHCNDRTQPRRVYATCFSNAASLWIMVKGEKRFIRDNIEVDEI